jgi:hypothetical protein
MEKKPGQFPENLKRHDEEADMRGMEANGYPADDTLYARDKDDETGDDDENTMTDWGEVDPQSHPDPHGTRDPMDPSGPGSAV